MMQCGRCLITHYCSKKCQTSHWSAGHKSACQQQARAGWEALMQQCGEDGRMLEKLSGAAKVVATEGRLSAPIFTISFLNRLIRLSRSIKAESVSTAALTLKAHIGLAHVGGACVCYEMVGVLSELWSMDRVRGRADNQHGVPTLWRRLAMLEIAWKFNKWSDVDRCNAASDGMDCASEVAKLDCEAHVRVQLLLRIAQALVEAVDLLPVGVEDRMWLLDTLERLNGMVVAEIGKLKDKRAAETAAIHAEMQLGYIKYHLAAWEPCVSVFRSAFNHLFKAPATADADHGALVHWAVEYFAAALCRYKEAEKHIGLARSLEMRRDDGTMRISWKRSIGSSTFTSPPQK